jgi:exodeoxyribonuclease VII large subunit
VLEGGLRDVWVVGEVSNFRAAASGHCYFTLKDDKAQISAVLFRSACARLRFVPRDGLEVVAGGRVKLYETRGTLQLYVASLEPRGVGALRLALEQLRDKLSAEGLLAPERKRPLPYLPRCVGVVTALGGAAIHDILTILRERFPNLRVVLRPVRVQGAGAERDIAQGIRDLETVPDLDVMIVGRGGGSVEDLWAFNDEGVARAIVGCRVPVVSAVGHEIDVTIADLVADARAPTPTAAAELVAPRKTDLAASVDERSRALRVALGRQLAVRRRAVVALRSRLRDPRRSLATGRVRGNELRASLVRAFARRLSAARDSVKAREPRLGASMRHRAEVARERLSGLAASLSSLSPLAVLERGYSVVWKAGDARPLRSAAGVAPGDSLRIRLAEGRLDARVESTNPGRSEPGGDET